MGKTINILLFLTFYGFHRYQFLPVNILDIRQNRKPISTEISPNSNRLISLFSITVIALTWALISSIAWGFYFAFKQKSIIVSHKSSTPINVENKVSRNPSYLILPSEEKNYNYSVKSKNISKVNLEQAEVESEKPNVGNKFHNSKRRISKTSFICCKARNSEQSTKTKRKPHQIVEAATSITPGKITILTATGLVKHKYGKSMKHFQVLSSTEIIPNTQIMHPEIMKENQVLVPVSANIPNVSKPTVTWAYSPKINIKSQSPFHQSPLHSSQKHDTIFKGSLSYETNLKTDVNSMTYETEPKKYESNMK